MSLLGIAAVTVLALAGGWIGVLQSRAEADRARADRLVTADRGLAELELLGWRAWAGELPPADALDEGRAKWGEARAELRAAHADRLAEGLARVGVGLPGWLRARSPALRRSVSSQLAIAGGLLDAQVGDAETAARESSARAWRLTALTAALAVALLGLLLTAWTHLRRAAVRALADAARAEGERRAFADSARRFHSLVQHASEGVLVLDVDGRVTFATSTLERLLGRRPTELLDRPFAAVIAPEDAGRLDALVAVARKGGAAAAGELVLTHRDGHPVHADVRVADRVADPDVGGVVLTVRDVSERRRLEGQLRRSARRDAVTGLANRTSFEDWLRDAVGCAERAPAVVLLGVDDLDTVTDSLGHVAGDRVLMACADRLRDAAGARRVARLGSDRFAVLLDAPGAEHAKRAARDLADALSAPVRLEDAEVPVSVSVGLAVAEPGLAAEDLLRCADTALHIAQARGAGELQAFSPAMHADALRRLKLRAALARAVEDGSLRVAYQPIVELERGEPVAVEALARFAPPGGDCVPPGEFIPVAEASGAIVELGAWVLEQACAEVAALRAGGGGPLRLCVNVSAVQLRGSGFAGDVTAALERSALPPDALTLELTESVLVEDVDAVADALAAVRALGVRIAVDDFGTGFSSLAALADLPVDELKLDCAFVAAMDGGGRHEALVGGMVSLADRLGLPLVAEGVETAAQLAALRRLGCGWAQGYHLGRPGPLSQVAAGALA